MTEIHLTEESIEKFRNSLSARGRSSMTVKSYCADLTGFLSWVQTTKSTHTTLEALAAQYLNETRAQVAPKTTLRRLTSLRAYALYNKFDGFLADYIGPKPGRAQPHPTPEGIDGWRKMIQYAATAETKALMTLLGLLGLRVSEARSIVPKSFEFENSIMLTVRGKGDKTRYVPVSPEAWNTLKDAFYRSVRDGKPLVAMNDSCARAHVHRIAKRAGMSGSVSSHDGRHTFATHILDGGGSIRVVQELLGHESLESTQVYTGVTKKALQDAVNFA